MKRFVTVITFLLIVSFNIFSLSESQKDRLERTYNMYAPDNEEYWSQIPIFQEEITEDEAKEYVANLLEASTMLDRFAKKFLAEYDENTDWITEAVEIQKFTAEYFTRRYTEKQELVAGARKFWSEFFLGLTAGVASWSKNTNLLIAVE